MARPTSRSWRDVLFSRRSPPRGTRLFSRRSPTPRSSDQEVLDPESLSRRTELLNALREHHNTPCVDIAGVSIHEVIGQGNFGTVHKCRVGGQPAACKAIGASGLTDEEISFLKNECIIWSRIAHDNIVGFLGLTFDAKRLWLLCEFMPDGNLSEKLAQRREAGASPLMKQHLISQLMQVGSGMRYLHALEPPVLHRDLKSSNIMLKGGRLAIADFGLACYEVPAGMHT